MATKEESTSLLVCQLLLYGFLACEAAYSLLRKWEMEANSVNNPDNDPDSSTRDPDEQDKDTDVEDKAPVDPGDASGESAGAAGQATP